MKRILVMLLISSLRSGKFWISEARSMDNYFYGTQWVNCGL